MRLSLQDYPLLVNLLLIPIQFLLIRFLPGMGLDGAAGNAQSALFMVLVWTGLILEFPALSLHVHLAHHRGAPGGFSRFIWVLIVWRTIILLMLAVLALNAVGVGLNHWMVGFVVPLYGLIYIFFCFFTDYRAKRAATPPFPHMRRLMIGAFAALWNLVLMTSLWNVIAGELSVGQPATQARLVVILLMGLLVVMLYVPARLPYILVEQAGLGDGLRRRAWYMIFVANIVTPLVAAYTR